jgi:hypothetical protein
MEIRGWVKPRGAAEYADVSEDAIREWMRSGLPYAPVSSRITLIRVSDIDNFIAARLRTRNDVDSTIDDVVTSILNSTKRGNNGRNRSRETNRVR